MQSPSGQVQALVQAEFGYAVTEVTGTTGEVLVKIGAGSIHNPRGAPATVQVKKGDGPGDGEKFDTLVEKLAPQIKRQGKGGLDSEARRISRGYDQDSMSGDDQSMRSGAAIYDDKDSQRGVEMGGYDQDSMSGDDICNSDDEYSQEGGLGFEDAELNKKK